eukprot:818064-Rhodomonas_salina.2
MGSRFAFGFRFGRFVSFWLAALCLCNVPGAVGSVSIDLKTKYVYYTTGTNLRNQVVVSILDVESWMLEVDAGPASSLRNFMRTNGRGPLKSFPIQFDWGQTNLFPTITVLVTVTDHANNQTHIEKIDFPV